MYCWTCGQNSRTPSFTTKHVAAKNNRVRKKWRKKVISKIRKHKSRILVDEHDEIAEKFPGLAGN
jgi:hypothetical protein